MSNQPVTASQKTDEVTNKAIPSVITDTILMGTGFTPFQWLALVRYSS